MFIQLLLASLSQGGIYALLAVALVLLFKTTNVVNFAQGEMGMVLTFLAFGLINLDVLPFSLIFALTIAIGLIFGALTNFLVIESYKNQGELNSIIITVGYLIVLHNLAGWVWGYDPVTFPSLFGERTIDFHGAVISMNSIGTVIIAILAMLCLFLFLNHSRQGRAMRAISSNSYAAQVVGIDTKRLSIYSWGIAGALSALCGLLVAPGLLLDFQMMGNVLLKAFAAAIIGGFTSLPGAVVGGLIVASIETFAGAYLSSQFKNAFAFVAIVAVLMIRPTGIFGKQKIVKV